MASTILHMTRWHSTLAKPWLRCRSLSTSALGPRKWRLGCWNQHRVSSYLQRNCPWIARLQEHSLVRNEMQTLLRVLPVQYDVEELHAWLHSADVVALQELDEPLREVLRSSPQRGQLLESQRHVDGRGVQVDCTVGMFVQADVEILETASADLVLPLHRGKEARRPHLAATLQSRSNGPAETADECLVLCSIHLHPPRQVEEANLSYLTYLEPLKEALSRLAASAPSPSVVAVVGDFNVAPEEFQARTSSDAFWSALSSTSAREEEKCLTRTAHASNPCEFGDFGVFGRSAEWRCEALGRSDFRDFEGFVDEVVDSVVQRQPWHRARSETDTAMEALQRAKQALAASQAPTGADVVSSVGLRPTLDRFSSASLPGLGQAPPPGPPLSSVGIPPPPPSFNLNTTSPMTPPLLPALSTSSSPSLGIPPPPPPSNRHTTSPMPPPLPLPPNTHSSPSSGISTPPPSFSPFITSTGAPPLPPRGVPSLPPLRRPPPPPPSCIGPASGSTAPPPPPPSPGTSLEHAAADKHSSAEAVAHDEGMSDKDLNSFTVVQLKEKLKVMGQTVTGKKADLVQRLQNAMEENSQRLAAPAPPSPPAPSVPSSSPMPSSALPPPPPPPPSLPPCHLDASPPSVIGAIDRKSVVSPAPLSSSQPNGSGSYSSLERAIKETETFKREFLDVQAKQCRVLRKGLHTSDHRPLLFQRL